MYYLHSLLLLILLVSSALNLFAQSNIQVLDLDEKRFQETIQKFPNLLNKNDWIILKQKVKSEVNNNKLDHALEYSKKALILAENLKDKLLVARSLHLLGDSYQLLEKLEIALSYYEKSFEIYTTLENSDATRIEAGYLMNDWASLYTDPYFNNEQKELVEGLKLLYFPFEMTNINQTAEFEDLKYLTYLKIGKAFGVSGHFISQIFWLEKLDSISTNNQNEATKIQRNFELHFELQKAYRRIGNYEKSFMSLTALNDFSKKQSHTGNQIKYLRELADFYGDISAFQKINPVINQALEKADKTTFQFGNLYTFKVLKLLRQGNFKEAKAELENIEILAKKGSKFNQLDLAVIRAVIFWYEGDNEQSGKQFLLADKSFVEYNSTWRSKLFILYWKSVILLLQKDYKKLKTINSEYLSLALEHNSKDSLPLIYLNLAKAEMGLGNLEQAKKVIAQASLLIDTKRTVSSAEISVGIVEILFEVYQLQTDLHLAENKIAEAFQSSESLKGRWLNEKIAGNPLKQKVFLDPKLKSEIFDLTQQILKNPKDEQLFAKLSELEKKAIFYEGSDQQNNEFLKSSNNLLSELEKSPIDNQTAIVSYTFTNEGKLVAFVWQRGKALEVKQLPIDKDEVDKLAKGIQERIKTLIFFKNEGQQIYDKLLKPLNLQAKHLIIIPDKGVWKIPFQALSEDGKTYLIENKTVSYAPSVSILVNQLNNPLPKRQTFQVFSNSRFNTIFLKYVDAEASNLATLFGVKPNLSATTNQFAELSGKSDILHFSMHAEVDNEEAFNSFLGFKPIVKDDGKLTVDDLLKLRLKKGSLVFLASCDTNNVFNGEGLVSLAWGMMGAGATTVISAQWEANDKSTAVFTNSFYKNYRQGSSAAESMQKAALELIKNKSNNMHEPYYWADFTLNGDFR